jgi:DNA transformation protein
VKRDAHRFDDLFHHFGRISVRRMFGGEGIFVGDLVIGLIADDRIHLKTGDSNRTDFEAENCTAFSFPRAGKMMALPYHAVPERLLDDPEEFGQWARKAHEVALAARAAQTRKRRRHK